MPALLVIVALLAVGFLVMWVRSNRALLAHQAEAAATQAMLATERNEARAEATTRTTERDETRARLKTRTSELEARTGELEAARAQITRLEAQRSQLSGAVRRQTGEIDELRSTVAEQEARIEAQSNEIGTLVLENNALEARAETAEAAVAAAEARNTGVVIGDELGTDDGHPATLWALELARSKRTWRTSVATNPFAEPTPFDETDDPVRLAVEVEAAALRENVGALVDLDWQIGPVTDPTRRHLIVRVAQELLEAAARNPEPLRLVVSGDPDVTLRLERRDGPADGPPVAITAATDVEIDLTEPVTVKSAP
ncbi:MAG: hypothetical protein OEY41_17235 [Acidimicrobiia bacterium]|nr:hypothetical protein [Acidimicrobiia bacterium]